jgi:ribonuclease-3
MSALSLPYTFRDPSLLQLALTHASVGVNEDNERAEFLGDAVLNLIVADELYRWHVSLPEGDLTEFKAWVVSRKVLADAARALGLQEVAKFGSGLQNRALPRSVLANLYEAVLGAVYLDGGFDAARAFALVTLDRQLERVRKSQPGPNPKQVFQQHCQKTAGRPPTYRVLDQRGKAHARAFLVAAEVDGRRFPSAWGRTRKEAERWAAQEALIQLEAEGAA